MLNKLEKHGMLKCIGALMGVIAVILLAVSYFVDATTPDMVLKIVGSVFLVIGIYLLIFKNLKEKLTKVGFVGATLIALSCALVAAAIFVTATNPVMILKLLALIFFVVGGLMISVTSEDHRLAKSIFVMVLTAIIFTWILPYGQFSGGDFYDYGMGRVGIVDISVSMYNALYYSMDKVVFLFILAGVYGVLSKVSGYQRLVTAIAEKCKKHTIVFAVVVSVFLFLLTSLFTQTFIVLTFVPFFVSILLKMNLDKLSAFIVTFGSVLVGILGATYGTEGISSFNYYIGTDITTGLNYRFIIAVVTVVLYNFFICMRLKKVLSETNNDNSEKNTKNNKNTKAIKNSEIDDDPFKVKVSTKKNAIPVAIVLFIVAIITILGYIAWEDNFEIAIFAEFHEWLTTLAPTEDFTIISYLLGQRATAFGEFAYVFTLCSVFVLVAIVIAFLYRMKVDEFIEGFYEGVKKMFKPIVLFVASYMVFGIIVSIPFTSTICNWVFNLVEGFNPFISSICAFIGSVFSIDLGYTGYSVGGFITSVYASNIDLVHAIYTSMYGLVGLFMPTSAILITGLSLMKIDYKSWLKYIWLFVVGMLIILLVLFTVVSYM